jgi:ribosomal protein L11 methyltransferase
MGLWKASFDVPYDVAEIFSAILENAYAPEALAVSTIETPGSDAPLVQTASDWNEVEAHGLWTVEALYEDAPDEAALRALLVRAETESQCRLTDVTIEQMDDVDWVTRSLEGLDPVRAGRFFVYGSHDADKVPAGVIPLLIDAGQAFGTGHHETTTGCLEFISDLIRPGMKVNALDIGTGTGVLAIAIAKLTHHTVVASDIDPVAVNVTNANARNNGVGAYIKARTAKGFSHPALNAQAPYELIIANILARPLVSLAPSFRTHLVPGGTLVLSGILRQQETMVTSAMRMQGLYLVDRKPKGDWVTLRIRG